MSDEVKVEKSSEERIVYNRPDHFLSLQKMREENEFCDVTIQVGNQSFRAHKLILSATINYFRSMFSNECLESNVGVIKLNNVNVEIVKDLINFAYTGQILLSEDNVYDLLVDADYFDVIDVKNECEKYLETHLNTQNVFNIYDIPEFLNGSLLNKAVTFAQNHFQEVSQTERFLNVCFTDLQKILSGNELRNISPVVIFESIIKWIMNKITERKVYLSSLMVYVNFSKLSAEYIIDFFFKNGASTNTENQSLMNDIIFYLGKFRNDNYISVEKVLVCIERNSHLNIHNVVISDSCIHLEKVKKIKDVPEYHNVFIHDKEVYLLGIHGDDDKFQVYDSEMKSFKSLSKMLHSRWFPGLVSSNGFLYACGGKNDYGYLNSVERYCSTTNEWELMAPMNYKRSRPTAVAFQEYIYIIGGYDKNTALNTVERYDSVFNKWTIVNSMNIERDCPKAVALNGKIYVYGGFDEKEMYSPTIEVYDPESDSWECAGGASSRYLDDYLLIGCMGKLFVIPQILSSDTWTMKIDIYNLEKHCWTEKTVTVS